MRVHTERERIIALERAPLRSPAFITAFKGYAHSVMSEDDEYEAFEILRERLASKDAMRNLMTDVGACEVLGAFDAHDFTGVIDELADDPTSWFPLMLAELALEHAMTCGPCSQRCAASKRSVQHVTETSDEMPTLTPAHQHEVMLLANLRLGSREFREAVRRFSERQERLDEEDFPYIEAGYEALCARFDSVEGYASFLAAVGPCEGCGILSAAELAAPHDEKDERVFEDERDRMIVEAALAHIETCAACREEFRKAQEHWDEHKIHFQTG
jgi:hypothetical protein